MEQSLPVKEFKLEQMCPNPSICMLAKRASGKSWVCRAILKNFTYLPGGLIISPTERMSSFYGKFFPQTYIHYEYSSDVLDSLLKRQREMINKCIVHYKKGKKVDPRAFLLMDDCLASKGTWLKDPGIMEMFFNGRHYQLIFILTMQYPLGITPEMRSNFDYIFLLADNFKSNRKRLYEHYAGVFDTQRIFEKVFDQLTENFGCMVIVNRGAEKDLSKVIFRYKAPPPTKDLFSGSQQFMSFHKNNFDPNWQMKGAQYDPKKAGPKTSIVVQNVKNDYDE